MRPYLKLLAVGLLTLTTLTAQARTVLANTAILAPSAIQYGRCVKLNYITLWA
jgi:hypothetical protein